MAPVTKTLYVLIGLPFSGKTTITEKLMKEHDALVIERDRFLESLRKDVVTKAKLQVRARSISEPVSTMFQTREQNILNDALTMEYVERVGEAVRNTDKSVVIVDGTHLQPLSRSFIRQADGWRKIALYVQTDPETCIARFIQAKPTGIRSTITPDLIRSMSKVVEPPTQAEGFDEIQAFG